MNIPKKTVWHVHYHNQLSDNHDYISICSVERPDGNLVFEIIKEKHPDAMSHPTLSISPKKIKNTLKPCEGFCENSCKPALH